MGVSMRPQAAGAIRAALIGRIGDHHSFLIGNYFQHRLGAGVAIPILESMMRTFTIVLASYAYGSRFATTKNEKSAILGHPVSGTRHAQAWRWTRDRGQP